MKSTEGRECSSFRDPSGFIFRREGILYRQICASYEKPFEHLMSSGLYAALTERGYLVGHETAEGVAPEQPDCHRIIRPALIPFVTYPYEWCFSQLKDSALLTLEAHRLALDFGMCLKDASAFNIQLLDGNATLIDTLSFDMYSPGLPWVAYRQFCQHFLAPLALMSYRNMRLNQLMRVFIDGVPLDLASSLLPAGSWLNPSILIHIHLHAKAQKQHVRGKQGMGKASFSVTAMRGLVESLAGAVRKLRPRMTGTLWAGYYSKGPYSSASLESKTRQVAEFISTVQPSTVWDFGANEGVFSELASPGRKLVLSMDSDPVCVERCYALMRSKSMGNMVPILIDLTNPSPSLGWHSEERKRLAERGSADMGLALALLHHLAIGNNVPFAQIARFFAEQCRWLLAEFVPKSDPMVAGLLAARKDVFDWYTEEVFVDEFSKHFAVRKSSPVEGTGRVLYLMERL